MRKMVRICRLLLLVGSLAVISQSAYAQPSTDAPPPPVSPPDDVRLPNASYMLDGAGYVGIVHYQERDQYFDERRFAITAGGDLQKRFREFLFYKVTAEIGGAADNGEKTAQGFRFQASGLGGITFGGSANYVAVGVGINIDGDVRGAVPTAITAPVDVSYVTWLGTRLRTMLWIRGDTFLAAKRTRREAADDIILNEFRGGVRLFPILEEKRLDKSHRLRGPSIGLVAHRTMGSTVWMLQLGAGANVVGN